MKKIALLLMLVLMLGFGYCKESSKSEMEISFGKKVDVNKYIKKGKINIIDFYSHFCPPCMEMAPLLKKLSELRKDIYLIKVNINRKDVKGIDWKSPVATQYKLKSIPNLWYVKKDGSVLKGKDARNKIETLLEPLRLSALDDNIKKDPKNALAYFQRGTYNLSKKNFDSAISDLSSSLKFVKEPHEEISFYLACAYSMKNDIKNALSELEDSLKLAKKHGNSRLLKNFSKVGFLDNLKKEKKYKELITKYSK